MPVNLQNIIDRVVLLEKAALAALTPAVTADAVDHFFHAQEATPYFTNRLGPVAVGGESEDYDEYRVDILIRLVIGMAEEGYAGEPDNRLQLYIPQVIEYFNERRLLIDSTYATELPFLVEARIVDCRGLVVFQNSGVRSSQVGTEFTLRCTLLSDITQVME